MTGQKELGPIQTDPNKAMNEILDSKESDNMSSQSFSTNLDQPRSRPDNSISKINENSLKFSSVHSVTNNNETPKSRELEYVVKLRCRGISKRKLKPSWKLSEYLGIEDAGRIDNNRNKKCTSNDDNSKKCSSVDDIDLEMEVVSVPEIIDESTSQAKVTLDERLSTDEVIEGGLSNKGQRIVCNSVNTITERNEHKCIDSEISSFHLTRNELVSNLTHQQDDGQSFENQQATSSIDGLSIQHTTSETFKPLTTGSYHTTNNFNQDISFESTTAESFHQSSICLDHSYCSMWEDTYTLRFQAHCTATDVSNEHDETRTKMWETQMNSFEHDCLESNTTESSRY